jgi:hypothetical protein
VNMGKELARYLSLGIDLQHRRVECCRYLKNGEPYQKRMEELVKWKQDRREGSLRNETSLPANWGTVYETLERRA